MAEAVLAIPGDLATPTGGYAYDRRVLELLGSYGIAARALQLPGSFPSPSAADLDETVRRLAATPADTTLVIDGLAFGAMPAAHLDRVGRRIIALIHHPLCLEAGLTSERAAELKRLEQEALSRAAHVIVTSPAMARLLVADFGVPDTRIMVAEPGTDPAQRATGTGTPLQLLAVGAVSVRKGYDILVEALAPLADLDWRLTIAGATDRAPEAVAELRAAIQRHRLGDKVTLAGTVVPATLERFYASADLFLMPSLFEGYGMVLAEAMARGLPIVCTTGGAAAETVPDAAAIKVAPGDVEALGRALVIAMSDKKLRARLADAAWEAGRRLPTWNETARRIAAVILEIPA